MSLTLAFVVAACLVQSQGDPGIITWRTYKAGVHSAAPVQEIVVMETLGDYQRYLRRFDPQGAGDGGDVDWKVEELVAIHVGERKTAGYRVEVASIRRANPRDVLVSWVERTPRRGSSQAQAMTSPYVIVRLNRTGGRLTFSGSKAESSGIFVVPGRGYGCACCEACLSAREDELPWRVYAHGFDAPTLLGSTFVMNNQQDFDAYVKNYQMPGLGTGRDVDWTVERLIAIHAGREPYSGYDVVVDRLSVEPLNRTDVRYLLIQPSRPVLSAESGNGPYVVIRTLRVGSVVSFGKRMVRDDQPLRLDRCGCGCSDCVCGRTP